MKIIEINGLTKQYGDYKAVNNLSFDVENGKMIGFLGVNGAGKSTTINILSTILKMDAGDVLIDGLQLGKDDNKIRKTIGVETIMIAHSHRYHYRLRSDGISRRLCVYLPEFFNSKWLRQHLNT